MPPATGPTTAANADYSASVRDAPEPAPGKRRFSSAELHKPSERINAAERRYLTSFVGRQDDLATLRHLLLSPGKPLITIIGTGGSGKTRLALQTIGSVREQFPDGVCFVPLEVIRRHTLVLAEIANKLGIKEMAPSNEHSQLAGGVGNVLAESRLLLQEVQQYINDSQLLLVLDNFEHVLAAAPIVAELLKTCSHLRVLITSREALRIQGEREIALEPLFLPHQEFLPNVHEISQYTAVELFIQRAQAANLNFTVTQQNLRTLVAICRKLDGLPLAIELAAAKLRSYSLESVLSRLEARFNFLTQGPPDLPQRQQTLQAAIAWSYDLLDVAEQRLFRRLAVFSGGCEVGAARAVFGAAGDLEIDPEAALISLAEKSLLQREGTIRGPRYQMFESIRAFGLELLESSGEGPEVRARYSEYFLHATQNALRPLRRTTQPDPMSEREWLETEIGNLRAVLEHAVEQGDARLGLPLAVLMTPFWLDLGHVSEGRQRLADLMQIERAAQTQPGPVEDSYTRNLLRKLKRGFDHWSNPQIGESTEVPYFADPWRTEAIKLAAYLAATQNDYEEAQAHLEELRAVGEEFGDEQLIESSIVPLGMISRDEAEPGSALYGELLGVLQGYMDSRNDRGAARILTILGMLAKRRHDVRAAEGFFQESLKLSSEAGDLMGMALVWLELAYIANPDDGVLLAQEGLQAARSSGDPRLTATVLLRVGQISAARGNLRAAATEFEEALRISEELGHRWLEAMSLFFLGRLALQSGNLEQAKSRLERAKQIQQALGNKAALAYTILALAELSMAQRQGSEQCWQAIEIFRSLANKYGEAQCLLLVGDGALAMSNYEEALKRFQDARAIFDEIKDSTSAANITVRMALVYRERSEYEQSQKLYEEALAIFQASKADALAANCIRLLGDLQRKQSNFDQARAYYEEALLLYRNIKNKSGIGNLLLALGDLSMELKE